MNVISNMNVKGGMDDEKGKNDGGGMYNVCRVNGTDGMIDRGDVEGENYLGGEKAKTDNKGANDLNDLNGTEGNNDNTGV